MINRKGLMAGAIFLALSASSSWATIACGQYPFENSAALSNIHAALSKAIAPFPQLADTLNSDLEMCLSDTMLAERGYYEPESHRIVLANDMTPGLTLAVAVHELRHVQQFGIGSCPSLDLSMKQYAQAVFAMEADASVTSLVVATYQRKQGDPAMWNALATWPMQADLAARFDATLSETSDIAAAASAAFSEWYESEERKQSYYFAACSNFLDQIDREHRLLQYNSLSDAYYADLCRLPDGSPYACESPAQ
jgi:hypothetical protein